MAIKRAPVLTTMQVYMTCDKCGALMEIKGFDYEAKMYKYECSCGHIELNEQHYPYQQVTFDRSKEEVLE